MSKRSWRRSGLRFSASKALAFTDDFFQLGGDSLAAADLVVQVQKVFGLTLPLTILMQAPTVESLAEVIRRHDGSPRDGPRSWSFNPGAPDLPSSVSTRLGARSSVS